MLWVNYNGAVGPIGGYWGNVTLGGHNWSRWMPGNETIGDVQFGHGITSSSGGDSTSTPIT